MIFELQYFHGIKISPESRNINRSKHIGWTTLAVAAKVPQLRPGLRWGAWAASARRALRALPGVLRTSRSQAHAGRPGGPSAARH